jgi:hypothetical protein
LYVFRKTVFAFGEVDKNQEASLLKNKAALWKALDLD